MRDRVKWSAIVALLVLVAGMVVVATNAEAGCLVENRGCTQCARGSMWQAMKNLSPSGIEDANLQLWDCSIDMYHCVLLGQHHSYSCAV